MEPTMAGVSVRVFKYEHPGRDSATLMVRNTEQDCCMFLTGADFQWSVSPWHGACHVSRMTLHETILHVSFSHNGRAKSRLHHLVFVEHTPGHFSVLNPNYPAITMMELRPAAPLNPSILDGDWAVASSSSTRPPTPPPCRTRRGLPRTESPTTPRPPTLAE